MKTILFALAFALGLLGCGGHSSDHPGHGVVVSVDATKGEVTLDHEDIPGLMTGMTMTFHADPALLAGIAAGEEVDFRAREEGGRYVVTAIEPRRP
jgi:Cu(I)/Ag(I) efflux system periplasmic protein CusF